MYKHLRI